MQIAFLRSIVFTRLVTLAFVSMLTMSRGAANEPLRPPATEKRPVSDTYHGTEVTEDYRWLEDSNDAAVKAWSDAQNAYARSILDRLPGREAIDKRVSEIMSAELVSYWGVVHHGGKYFAMKEQPPKQQPFLVVSDSLDDLAGERVLVDPNEARQEGRRVDRLVSAVVRRQAGGGVRRPRRGARSATCSSTTRPPASRSAKWFRG